MFIQNSRCSNPCKQLNSNQRWMKYIQCIIDWIAQIIETVHCYACSTIFEEKIVICSSLLSFSLSLSFSFSLLSYLSSLSRLVLFFLPSLSSVFSSSSLSFFSSISSLSLPLSLQSLLSVFSLHPSLRHWGEIWIYFKPSVTFLLNRFY